MKKTLIALALVVASATALFVVPALAASTKTVKVEDNKFVAKSVTVKKGTTIDWKWSGAVPHNVTVTSGPKKFHSKTQTTGSFKEKLTKPGTYKIVCTIHKSFGMVMTVKVTK